MIVFISPAKGFNNIESTGNELPIFYKDTKKIISRLKRLNQTEISNLMKVNKEISKLNYNRYKSFKIDTNGMPAILAYDGLQYKNMMPSTFSIQELNFSNEHIRILSGLYGILKPLDSIYPYRLEMQTKLDVKNYNNLYEFWGDKLYKELEKDSSGVIINLSSDEYSKCIKKYVSDNVKFISCSFKVNKNGKMIVHSTSSKTARGQMVNFIVKNNIDDYEKLKEFNEDGYKFVEEVATEKSNIIEYVFYKSN